MKIMKFGGTSVGLPHRMHEVARLVNATSEPVIVVLSALSGTTNVLVGIGESLAAGDKVSAKQKIEALYAHYLAFYTDLVTTDEAREKAREIIEEHFEFLNIILKISFNQAINRDILAQGELLSTKLFSVYLEEAGIPAVLLSALDFMSIDENHEPELPLISERLQALLAQHPGNRIFVTQGYICKNSRQEVDNLKRGGSDYSASLIGAAMRASVIEIWTDIDGMHNNDPRVVKNTRPIASLSFDEAAELAYFGAKILHPASIWPAQQFNVPVKLLNTMQPEASGTTITATEADAGIKAIAAKDGIIAVKIKSSRMLLAYGFLRRVFEVFEKYKTPIDMITTSEVAVSLTIDDDTHLGTIVRELEQLGIVEVDRGQSIICIVGNLVAEKPGILHAILHSMKEIPLRMVSYGGSRHNVSVLVKSEYKEQSLHALNEGLFSY
jgi:aspartate kinase